MVGCDHGTSYDQSGADSLTPRRRRFFITGYIQKGLLYIMSATDVKISVLVSSPKELSGRTQLKSHFASQQRVAKNSYFTKKRQFSSGTFKNGVLDRFFFSKFFCFSKFSRERGWFPDGVGTVTRLQIAYGLIESDLANLDHEMWNFCTFWRKKFHLLSDFVWL